jgi:hypothetical protein
MTLYNLDRDMYWRLPVSLLAGFSQVAKAVNMDVTQDGVVYDDVGIVRGNWFTSAATAGSVCNAGVLMAPPVDTADAFVYRIKGAVAGSSGVDVSWVVGQAGTLPNIENCQPFAAGREVDATVAFRSNNVTDPVCFFASVDGAAVEEFMLGLSVQRMAVAPPQYVSAVR